LYEGAVGGEGVVDLFEGDVGGVLVGDGGAEAPEESEGVEGCAAGGGVEYEAFGGAD